MLVSNPINDSLIKKLLSKTKVANLVTLTSYILGLAISSLNSRQEEWRKDSYIMILEGRINAIRITMIENTVSEYPKVYRIVERI